MTKQRKVGNNFFMNKKEYLEIIENLIINKIKYHAPNLANDNIDYELLDAIGIYTSLPLFLYKKPLDKLFFQAFLNVKKKVDFNLILTSAPLIIDKKVKLLKNTYVILENELGSNLNNTLEALNINYISHSDFCNKLEGEYLAFNGEKVEFEFVPYYYTKKLMKDGVIFKATNFLLNGKNYILNFTNTKNTTQKLTFEINIPLPRGYYFFKKGTDFIEIENLSNKQKAYFNYHFKNVSFYFSNMNGIDSCTFACIHVFGEITLLPKQNKKCYFNYGENKYCIYNPNDMQYFFEISQQKINQLFDVKVTTHDKLFDQTFNFSLPYKIWEMWQKNGVDEKSENEWLKMKSQIIKNTSKGLQINEEFKGLKEVKIYRNLAWKRVFIIHNNARYMFADKIKYFNYTLLTNEIFNKNNEIYLSFTGS